jgi:hypothetical protein
MPGCQFYTDLTDYILEICGGTVITIYLLFARSNLHGLYVDTVANKLYVSCRSVLELNLDGSGERIAFGGDSIGLWEPTIYQGKFYFGVSDFGNSGIYTATLNPNKTVIPNR